MLTACSRIKVDLEVPVSSGGGCALFGRVGNMGCGRSAPVDPESEEKYKVDDTEEENTASSSKTPEQSGKAREFLESRETKETNAELKGDQDKLPPKSRKVIQASSPTKPDEQIPSKEAAPKKSTNLAKEVTFVPEDPKPEEPPYERVPPPNVVGESTTKSSLLHMHMRMKNYKTEATIRLIEFDKFKKQREIPRFPDCQDITEVFDAETHNYIDTITVFISHSWISGWDGKGPDGTVLSSDHNRNWRGKPHPDNKKNDKFKLICEGVESIWMSMAPTFSKCYLWIDFSCINQDLDPAGELQFLDLLVRVCDFMVTPVVDYKHNEWKVEKSFHNWFEAYKAVAFRGSRYSYLSRAWCRVEMLFASTIPFADHEGDVRTQKFKGALKESASKGIRSHFVYGTKENAEGSSGRVLPPLAHSYLSEYSPLSGYLSVASDKDKIEALMMEIRPYLKEDVAGLEILDSDSEDEKDKDRGGVRDPSSQAKDEDKASADSERRLQRRLEKEEYLKKSGKYSGNGRFQYGDGNSFEGKFKDGKRHGPGKFVYANGDAYDGEYKDDCRERQGVMTFGTNQYSGQWKNNMRDGQGTLTTVHPPSKFTGEFKEDFKVHGVETFEGGGTYEGAYYDDLKSGLGSFTFGNGDSYNGEWVEDQMHGVGRYEYSSGSSYEGFFVKGKMHGRGRYVSKDGVYEGMFENDVKNGKGKYVWPNGETYEGDYMDNVRHGDGVYTYKNGDVYKGNWTADKQTGQGTQIGHGGELTYSGAFVDGMFEGHGVLDMKGRRYEGAFVANTMHGNGTLKYQNGNIYVGSFEKGLRSGQGHLIYAKGDEYLGPWKDDKMEGIGKFTFKNGDVYEGQFKEGKRHGRGTKTLAATGEKKEGLWADDKFHSPG